MTRSRARIRRPRIVLAGLPGFGDVTAWDFLDALYGVPGIKRYFDAAALHPYAPELEELGAQIDQLRATMTKHGDQATPLWLTELGWGSGAPDRFRLNKGLAGQAYLLTGAFRVDPQQPKRLERAARVLVRLARSRADVRVGGHLQLLRQRGIAEVHARAEAGLPGVQELRGWRLMPSLKRSLRLQLWSWNYEPEPTAMGPMAARWAEAMSARGHQVEVVTAHPHYPGPLWGRRLRPYRETRNGIPVLRLPLLIGHRTTAARILEEATYAASAAAAAALRSAPDVAVAVSPSFLGVFPVLASARFRRFPWILWLEDILPDAAATTGLMREGLALRTARHMERFMYRSAARIVVISDAFRENLLGKGVPPWKVTHIYNPYTRGAGEPRGAQRRGSRARPVHGKHGLLTEPSRAGARVRDLLGHGRRRPADPRGDRGARPGGGGGDPLHARPDARPAARGARGRDAAGDDRARPPAARRRRIQPAVEADEPHVPRRPGAGEREPPVRDRSHRAPVGRRLGDRCRRPGGVSKRASRHPRRPGRSSRGGAQRGWSSPVSTSARTRSRPGSRI